MLKGQRIIIVGDVLIGIEDLVGNASARKRAAFDVKHGRVCPAFVVRVVVDVGIHDRRFRLHPADKITRALIAGGGAKRQNLQLVAELFTQELLDLAPIVRGYEGTVLQHLRRTCHICDNARDLTVFVEGVENFDTAVIAALKLGEVGGVGVAPHQRRTVVIAGATAHADRSPAEAVRDLCRLAGVPGTYDCLSDLLRDIRRRLVLRQHIFRLRSGTDIFPAVLRIG